jgi:hypothetical protein
VTNSSKSAYSLVTLQPAFFSKYRPLGNAAEQRRGVKCQLYVKVSSGTETAELTPTVHHQRVCKVWR